MKQRKNEERIKTQLSGKTERVRKKHMQKKKDHILAREKGTKGDSEGGLCRASY